MPTPAGGVTCTVKLAVNGTVAGFGTVGVVMITATDAVATTVTALDTVTVFPDTSDNTALIVYGPAFT